MSELQPGTRYRIMGQVTLAVDAPSPQGRVQIEIDGEVIGEKDYDRYQIKRLESDLSVIFEILPDRWPTDRRMILLIEDESREGAIVVTNMDDQNHVVPRRYSEDPEIAAVDIKWSGEWKMEVLPKRYLG